MITFVILLVTLLVSVLAAALIALAGGVSFLLAFGDVIVCGLIIGLLIRLFRKKK